MGRFWNRDLKRILAILALIAISGGVFFHLAFFRFREKKMQDEYNAFAGIVGAVVNAYPETPQEELIRIISNAGGADMQQGREILSRYGIFENTSVIPSGEAIYRGFQVHFHLIFLLTAGLCIASFLWFWKKRIEKLRNLCGYLDRIGRGEYDLEIRDNQEDEFSGLKNELYKLMVLFREQVGNAKQGKEALAEALANISHQLKTPLTSAVVLADNLLEDGDMEPSVRQRFLQEISRQLIGMKWLVLTLLKLSRLDAGVVEMQKKEVSLQKVVEEVLQNLELNADWKEIRFQTTPADAHIMGDRKWLAEALQNIVKNALEYSPQKGTVEIDMEDNDIYAQIVVKDHGPGISEQDQKHLFERFYRASKVENENAGIGLALAKEIIERHNGYLTVESTEGGTAFIVKFLKNVTEMSFNADTMK